MKVARSISTMERTNKTNSYHIVLFLCFFILIFQLFGQSEKEVLPSSMQKYRMNVSEVFHNDITGLQKVTDELYYQIEIAERSRKKIIPVTGYENARNAYHASFTISIEDICRKTSSYQLIFLNNANDSCFDIGVRCYTDIQGYLGTEDYAKSLQGKCLSSCGEIQIRNDSIITFLYEIPVNVHVAKLNKVRCRYVMSPIATDMDDCGVFVLTVPKNEESIFAFYNTPNYICLIRFSPSSFVPTEQQ